MPFFSGCLSVQLGDDYFPKCCNPNLKPMNPGYTLRTRSTVALAAIVLTCSASHLAAQQKDDTLTALKEDTLELSPFEVRTSQDVGYRSMFSNSGSLVAEELKNLPSSITTLNRELIDDTGVINVFELSRYAPGGEFVNNPTMDTQFVFRGLSNEWQTRNFFIWYLPTDAFSVERVEVLRGPNALLYGDAQPGGLLNIITKRALLKDFGSLKATVGSWEFYRGEIDINRKLNDQLAVRATAATSRQQSFYDYRYNNFDGLHLALTYRPFRKTQIRFEAEGGKVNRNTGATMFVDAFSSYDPGVGGTTGTALRTGDANNYYISYDPSTISRYGTAGFLRTNGTNFVIDQNSAHYGIAGREWQFVGASAYADRDYYQWSATIEQAIFEKLNFEATFNRQDQVNTVLNGNGGAHEIRRDPNALLPNGTANPNYNELYVDNMFFLRKISNKVNDIRAALTYELDLPFGISQRLLAFGTYRHDDFVGRTWEERSVVNPAVQVWHRTYLRDYPTRSIEWNLIPGQTELFGASFWGKNVNMLTSQSYVALGSYWDGRIRSMVGYRRDWWDVDRQARVDQAVNGVVERVGFNPNVTSDARLKDDSLSYGGVFHLLRDFHGSTVSLVGNYSESFRPTGNEFDVFGNPMDPIKGKGREAGLRLDLLSGKVAVTGTLFNIDVINNRIGVNQTARNEINTMFGAGTVEPTTLGANGDTTQRNSKGYEFELALNLTKGWTMTANYSHNDLSDQNVFPRIRSFWERAVAENRPIAEYSNLNTLVSNAVNQSGLVAPERDRSINLFTRYTFLTGALKGFSLGGGVNYRSEAYLAVANNQAYYSPDSTVYNALLGYRTKLIGRDVSFTLNINNLTDEITYTSYGFNSGQWTPPREFRFSTTFKF